MGKANPSDGLNKINACDNPTRAADVVFIHGLDGDAFSTWCSEGKDENFWPKWLGEDLPAAGVWSLGYAVSSSAWKGSTMPLADRATNVLDKLEMDGIGNRPVIFICHSLGGLLVKQMLRHANDFGNAQYRRIADQTCGIVFLSTPYSGSNIANWMNHLGWVLRMSVSVEELEAHHSRLRELNTWFRNHSKTPQIETIVYCEKRTLNGLLVVDETSADPGIRGVIPIPMEDDHITICKPKGRTAQVYRRVKKLVEKIVAGSSRKIGEASQVVKREGEYYSGPEKKTDPNPDYDDIPDPARLEKHLEFQSQIRVKIEQELAKDTVMHLREGFIEIVWKNAGKEGTPAVPELVNALFSADETSGLVDPGPMLEKLLHATEACLERLEAVGERISENHIIWKTAKQLLGWLVTLAVRSELLPKDGNAIAFDEIDVETSIGVEIYTSRKKEITANFKADDTETSPENIRGANEIDCFFPETGWLAKDVMDQICLIVWKAVGNKGRSAPLTEGELKKLDKTLELHRTRHRDSINYYLAPRRAVKKNPLLIPDICRQIKAKLPELTIVHVGTETGNGALLMIDEGILGAYIQEILNLIERYGQPVS